MPWTWHWHTHPEVWALGAALIGAYAWAVRVLGPRHVPVGPAATRAQTRNEALAVLAIVVAAEWPVHDLAERYLYSVHMVQHLIITMAVPPLVLTGLPAWLVRVILPPGTMRVARALTRPIVALAIFNGMLVLTHWPPLVEASVGNEAMHFGIHVLLFLSALVMWTPVLSPVLELPRLAYPGQMLYLFLQSIVPTVPASFLTFGNRLLYPVYGTFPRVADISALTDQRAAGLIMKIAGGAVLWSFIAVIFFRWFRMERDEGVDALEWQQIDRSLNRMVR